MTEFKKFDLQPQSLEPTKSKVPVGYSSNSMSDLANSSNAAANDVDGRIQVTKPGANVNAVLPWKQAQKVSVAQKFLRFSSQDFQIRCNFTLIDQIHIIFHDMLCEKNPLTI